MHVPEREFYCNKVVCFDLKTCKWTRLAALPDQSDPDSDGMPEGRRSHSALNLKGSLVIFGGFNSRWVECKGGASNQILGGTVVLV